MIILLTNDDGVGAPGLEALAETLGTDHDVWIVAPDREMSGRSHGITLNEGLKVTKISPQCYSCRGTPVDCVGLGVMGILPEAPALVLSGINNGPNLGTDLLYSGTAAAAREAALRDIPAVAISHGARQSPWNFEPAARFIAANLSLFLDLWNPGHFVNINWPDRDEPIGPPAVTVPGRRRYNDRLVRFAAPRGGDYWFLQPAGIDSSLDEGSDTAAIEKGRISISPVAIEPVAAPMAKAYREARWSPSS